MSEPFDHVRNLQEKGQAVRDAQDRLDKAIFELYAARHEVATASKALHLANMSKEISEHNRKRT